jgi:hypothetical protein
MKKIFFFTAITFLTLSSCRKEATTLSQDQTVAESQLQTNASSSQTETNASSSGGAKVEIINLDGEQVYNSCTKESMTLYGNIRVVVQFIDNSPNKATFTLHTNGTGIRAIGESGREYTLSGTDNYQVQWFSNGVTTTKEVNNIRFTTAGSESNFIVSYTIYVKVDGDGNVTVIREEVFETSCQ